MNEIPRPNSTLPSIKNVKHTTEEVKTRRSRSTTPQEKPNNESNQQPEKQHHDPKKYDKPWRRKRQNLLRVDEMPNLLPFKPKFQEPQRKKPYFRNIVEKGGTDYHQFRALDFSKIDSHAFTAHTAQICKNLDTLAKYLGKACTFEIEKVRIIFRWVTEFIAYDDESLVTPTVAKLNAEDILARRLATSEGYANIFFELAKRTGLECRKIKGFAKGFTHRVGKKLENTNHAWNAVMIQNGWYLLDTCWAAGHITKLRFEKTFKEHYFLTSPKRFVMDHYPINPQWQFLEPAVPKTDFDAFAFVTYVAWENGIYPEEHIHSVIELPEDKNYLVLPFYAEEQVFAAAEVTPLSKSYIISTAKAMLFDPKFIYVQHFLKGFKVAILFPHDGAFRISIFVKRRDTKAESVDRDYGCAFEYLVNVHKGLKHDVGWPEQSSFIIQEYGKLFSPLQDSLIRAHSAKFAVKLKSMYEKCAINLAGNFVYLIRHELEDDEEHVVFEGEVPITIAGAPPTIKEKETGDIFSSLYQKNIGNLKVGGKEVHKPKYFEGMPVALIAMKKGSKHWYPLVTYKVFSEPPIMPPFGSGMHSSINQSLEMSPGPLSSLTTSGTGNQNKKKKMQKPGMQYDDDEAFVEFAEQRKQKNAVSLADAPKEAEFTDLESVLEASNEVLKRLSPLWICPSQIQSLLNIELGTHQFMLIDDIQLGSITIRLKCGNTRIPLYPCKLEQYGVVLKQRTTWIVRAGVNVHIKVVLPQLLGKFLFRIMADLTSDDKALVSDEEQLYFPKSEEEENKSLTPVLQFIIDTTKAAKSKENFTLMNRIKRQNRTFCFPKVMPMFQQRRCVLYSPFQVLKTGCKYYFKVWIPNVKTVAVITSGIWYYLQPVNVHNPKDEELMNEPLPESIDTEAEKKPRLQVLSEQMKKPKVQKNDDYSVADFDLLMNQVFAGIVPIRDTKFNNLGPTVVLVAQDSERFASKQSSQFLPYIEFTVVKNYKIEQVESEQGSTTKKFMNNAILDDIIQPYDMYTPIELSHEMLQHFKPLSNKLKLVSCAKSSIIRISFSRSLSLARRRKEIQIQQQEERNQKPLNVMFDAYSDEETEEYSSEPESVQLTSEEINSLPLLEAEIYADLYKIEKATLIQQAPDDWQIMHVMVKVPSRPGHYYLKLSVVVFEDDSKYTYEGTSYWLKVVEDNDDTPTEANVEDKILAEINGGREARGKVPIGLAQLENIESFRPCIYFPQTSFIVLDRPQLVKIFCVNTDDVAMCSAMEMHEGAHKYVTTSTVTYMEWQHLENDDVHDPFTWEGEIRFTKGRYAVVMVRVDSKFYAPIATYDLVQLSSNGGMLAHN